MCTCVHVSCTCLPYMYVDMYVYMCMLLLFCCYVVAIMLLCFCYSVAILLLFCCYFVAILLLFCCYFVAILLLFRGGFGKYKPLFAVFCRLRNWTKLTPRLKNSQHASRSSAGAFLFTSQIERAVPRALCRTFQYNCIGTSIIFRGGTLGFIIRFFIRFYGKT